MKTLRGLPSTYVVSYLLEALHGTGDFPWEDIKALVRFVEDMDLSFEE